MDEQPMTGRQIAWRLALVVVLFAALFPAIVWIASLTAGVNP